METVKTNISKKRISVVDIQLVRKGSLLSDERRINHPGIAAEIFRKLIGDSDREHVAVIGVNIKNEPIMMQVVHIGSLNASIVSPREIFKSAILSNCATIFLAHCHPSGDITPSSEDIYHFFAEYPSLKERSE